MEANATAKGMLSVIAGGELAAIAQITQRATAQVRVRQGGGGSGIVWRENGLVVTNAHVVRGRRAEVKLANGETFHASVAKRDDARDLALLKLESFEPLRLTTAVVGDSDRLRAGEIVFAVGHPFGADRAVTIGIVHSAPGSQTGKHDKKNLGGIKLSPARTGRRWVQADVRLAPGNSGGPLANSSGQVIGVNTMIASGLGLAVPSNAVNSFVRSFELGDQRRPQIGVNLVFVEVPMGSEVALGMMATHVADQSLAEKAGLVIGDVLVGVDDRLFGDADELTTSLDESVQRGVALKLNLLRGGELLSCQMTLEAQTTASEMAEAA